MNSISGSSKSTFLGILSFDVNDSKIDAISFFKLFLATILSINPFSKKFSEVKSISLLSIEVFPISFLENIPIIAPGSAIFMSAETAKELCRLDICVNNAAVAPHASLLEERVEVWDTVYAVNCRGTFLMTQAAARVMIEQKRGGRIINFSSGVSKRGSAGAAAYASSRAATESFSRVAAIELAPYDILVNTVSPGLIDTQPKPLPPRMAESLKKRIPTLPLARPGTVAAMTLLFILAIRELGSSLFLYTSDTMVMAVLLLDYYEGGNTGKRPPSAWCRRRCLRC